MDTKTKFLVSHHKIVFEKYPDQTAHVQNQLYH